MIKTYLFDQDEWESAYGMAIRQDFYLMHFFEGDVYIGALKFNGSYAADFLTVTPAGLEQRYWKLYE